MAHTDPAHLIVTLLLFAVAVTSTVCARMTRPDRNYYPMQRVLWSILGFIYGGGAFSALLGGTQRETPLAVRAAFTAIVLLGTAYPVYFMRRRNTTPRFVPLDLAGEPVMVAVDTLRQEFDRTASYLGHGAMPDEWVAELDAARKRWQVYADWRASLRADVRERRRQRGIE